MHTARGECQGGVMLFGRLPVILWAGTHERVYRWFSHFGYYFNKRLLA